MRKQSINFFKKIFMTVRKNARPAGFVLLLAIAWTAVSCEMNTTVDAEHEPVLQIDAVLYSDEPLPEIRIRQSFRTARKAGSFMVDRDALEISGAEIDFYRNGEPVSVTEESPGHYRPNIEVVVEAGDQFEIHVRKDGMQASAVAVVPDHSAEQIAIEPTTEIEAIWGAGDLPVQFRFPFKPEFTAIRVYSDIDLERDQQQGGEHLLNGSGNLSYKTYYGRDHDEEETLSITHMPRFQFPFGEEDIDQKRTLTWPLYVDMVIPEPVYETWHRHRSNYGDFTPLTVTNVDGGVGMFFGAVRVHIAMDTELIIHFKRSSPDW